MLHLGTVHFKEDQDQTKVIMTSMMTGISHTRKLSSIYPYAHWLHKWHDDDNFPIFYYWNITHEQPSCNCIRYIREDTPRWKCDLNKLPISPGHPPDLVVDFGGKRFDLKSEYLSGAGIAECRARRREVITITPFPLRPPPCKCKVFVIKHSED